VPPRSDLPARRSSPRPARAVARQGVQRPGERPCAAGSRRSFHRTHVARTPANGHNLSNIAGQRTNGALTVLAGQGRVAWWWQIQDSNLGSLRDGFTGRHLPPADLHVWGPEPDPDANAARIVVGRQPRSWTSDVARALAEVPHRARRSLGPSGCESCVGRPRGPDRSRRWGSPARMGLAVSAISDRPCGARDAPVPRANGWPGRASRGQASAAGIDHRAQGF
jgi:hypothetical protein